MKSSGQCVKCGNRRLWIVDRVQQEHLEYSNVVWPMVVTSHVLKPQPKGNTPDRISPGAFQTIICAACGYTEWYAYNFEGLKDVPGARLVGDDSSDGGPYR